MAGPGPGAPDQSQTHRHAPILRWPSCLSAERDANMRLQLTPQSSIVGQSLVEAQVQGAPRLSACPGGSHDHSSSGRSAISSSHLRVSPLVAPRPLWRPPMAALDRPIAVFKALGGGWRIQQSKSPPTVRLVVDATIRDDSNASLILPSFTARFRRTRTADRAIYGSDSPSCRARFNSQIVLPVQRVAEANRLL